MTNIVYIATSLDGYIADSQGGLDWLHAIPNPDHDDLGWAEFISGIDALVMGRTTFETVCSFDVPWPYPKPVFVLSNSLKEIPEAYRDKAQLVTAQQAASLELLVKSLNDMGYQRLYIDGGKTIQSFMAEDLVDELIITQIPVLLGGGSSLFGTVPQMQNFSLVSSKVLLGAMVKNHWRRER